MPQIGKDGRLITLRLDREEADTLLVLLDFARAWMDQRRMMGAHPMIGRDTALVFAQQDVELVASLNALEAPLYGVFMSSRV